MQGTYEMMKKVLTGNEGEFGEITLIQEYKDKLSPNILAYFYCNNFKIISNIANEYGLLDNSDKASICLQVLDMCLQSYDETKNTKLMTYFINCYKNKLIEYQHRVLFNSNKANVATISIEYCENLIDNCNLLGEDTLEEVLDKYKLEEKDKIYCRLLDCGYVIKDIASYLGISKSKVYKDIAKIKEKFLQNCIKLT